MKKHKTSIDEKEVKKFTELADRWWDEEGEFKPLHKFNPIRIEYVKNQIIKNFNIDKYHLPLQNLEILDIGCGGGLLCEPMARLGANVTGIDAGEKNIKIAALHAVKSNLNINYRHITVEESVKENKKFDVILTMEVIEHVANVEEFIDNSCKLLKKDGLLFIASLNKTLKSYLFAIIGAEYILKWLPKNTHDWNKFLTPGEVNQLVAQNNLKLLNQTGFKYNLLADKWSYSDNLDVNYVMCFRIGGIKNPK